MVIKKCCIANCNSCSTRKEDVGVTYHKFPKDSTLHNSWITVTCHKHTDLPSFVCSRHFRKRDFKIYKDSKYVLKPDAIPSIFPWAVTNNNKNKSATTKMEKQETAEEANEDAKETLNSSKGSEGENLEAIKKFIEDQEKDILEQKLKNEPDETAIESDPPSQVSEQDGNAEVAAPVDIVKDDGDNPVKDDNKADETENLTEKVGDKEAQDETMAVASSVMDMILSESEAKVTRKKDSKLLGKQTPAEKANSSMALSVGSKVEAKDFSEDWYPAQIVEVDYEEMEVLVHYENVSKKHDEWISVSSPRLRPIGSPSTKPLTPAPEAPSTEVSAPDTVQVKEEPKPEEKYQLMFVVGERCLARWRDNRRFIATICEDLGHGKYEIIFDDGVRWVCATSRLRKLKEPTKNDPLTVDTTFSPPGTSTPSPEDAPGPGAAASTPLPAYHTHLFDPARDYLGSKSERREMKRKLNIKEIFNIGQKKKKIETTPNERPQRVVKEKKAKVVKNKVKLDPEAKVKTEVKTEIPDAVASIIGTFAQDVKTTSDIKEAIIIEAVDIKEEIDIDDLKIDIDDDMANSETLSAPESQDIRHGDDPALDEEVKLEQFDRPDDAKHEQVIDRIKEVITKLEGGLNQAEKVEPPTPETKQEIKSEDINKPVAVDVKVETGEKPKKSLSKVKKGKKLRMLQEKKVKKQVEKVKSELEEMKKQVEEMRKQMLMKTEELARNKPSTEMPESFLLPGEWCCKWVNGQPVGKVSEMMGETKPDASSRPALPRRSVQVEDKRLPPGWMKHMVRRSFGSSAGKWDVVLVSPGNKRFHTKVDMRNYLANNPDEALKPYETVLQDFGVHLKLSRRMGWYTTTPDGEQENPIPVPAETLSSTSPLVKRKNLSLKRSLKKKDKKKKTLRLKLKVPREYRYPSHSATIESMPSTSGDVMDHVSLEHPPLEDGYVYVGSLKVQIIENLLRCPADGCFKNFRNDTLLKMHIKHYHRELRKMLGATPQVLDLAYARARPTAMEMRRLKLEAKRKTIKIKLPRLPKRVLDGKSAVKDATSKINVDIPPVNTEGEKLLRPQDSPQLRNALVKKPVRRPKVLLPVRRPEPAETAPDLMEEDIDVVDTPMEAIVDVPLMEPLDFETAISTHTVTKPVDLKRKGEKKRKSFASIARKTVSEDEEWFAMNNSDVETRSSYPRSGTPDSKIMDQKLLSSESNEDQKDPNLYMYTDTGERIKLVHMKREEIINCHCGFREEDGLMVQCELCLCWQHALCHNIQKESEVPEKYTCSICLSPRRGRRSQRFLHDQDRLYEGLLPGAKPCESLRRSHELSGNLLRIDDALQALRVKYYVATKKDHPKLYLWAKDWETGEIALTQEKLNSDYSDLNIMISTIDKENLPVRDEAPLGMGTPLSEEHDGERFSHKESQLGSQALLSGLLSSPGGASLDLPISTSELERLAKSVQEQESQRVGVVAPQPEAAIENSACRERLLRHIQRCQTLIDARLDSIEAQVAELESQDPSFEDDETADYFPRTKQTVQMLMRDLDTMEELGVIT